MNGSNYTPMFVGLQYESLLMRLIHEVVQNIEEFKKNPTQYIKSIASLSKQESKRLELIMWCMASAFFAFVATFGVFFVIPRVVNPPQVGKIDEKQDLQVITMLEPLPLPPLPSKAGNGAGFGAKQPGGGGGGGGNHELTPASKGRLPQASLTAPLIVAPSTHQRIEQPSLPVAPIVRVDPNLMPKQDLNLPLGDPKGVPGPPSDGPGSGGGIGSGKGGGVGSGSGPGVGPGTGGGIGGGIAGGTTGGGGNGSPSSRPVILAQMKPKYTEEARQNKIQGKVVLSVEFRADGTIGDIKILRSLGYGLDENAIAAARQIRFKPATSAGIPVATRAKVEFSFNLI